MQLVGFIIRNCVYHFVIIPALRQACENRLKWLAACSVLVIHLAAGTAAYLNNDNLTCSDNCHVELFYFAVLCTNHWILSSHTTQHFSTHFVASHIRCRHSTYTHTQNIPFFSSLFLVLFSADVTFSSLIRFLSFSCSHFPISFFLLTDTHTHTLRVKPTEQFIRCNIETVHKRRSLGSMQWHSLVSYTHTYRQHPDCHPLVPNVVRPPARPSLRLYTPNYLLVNV